MGRFQHDFRRNAGVFGLGPARRAEAPAVAGLESGEAVFEAWCGEVVADAFAEGQKLFGDVTTDQVQSLIAGAGVAAAIAEPAGDGIDGAGFEICAEYVFCHDAKSIA